MKTGEGHSSKYIEIEIKKGQWLDEFLLNNPKFDKLLFTDKKSGEIKFKKDVIIIVEFDKVYEK